MKPISTGFDSMFRVGGAALVVVGILLVLKPFLSSMLVAGVLAIATWPLFLRLRKAIGGSSTLAASIMLALIVLLVVLPIAMLAGVATEELPELAAAARSWAEGGLHVPEFLKSIPFVGEKVYSELGRLLTDRNQWAPIVQRALEPAGKLMLSFVRVLGDGIVELLLVCFIVFFFYRDGESIVAMLRRISERLSGALSAEVLQIVTGTTRSVFIGIVGTAAAQGIVALIGFLIAGVPGAFLLAVGTFVLSVVPMGPVFLWGGAAIWLYAQGQPGWAIFMVIWGAVVISSIDNFLKPILIARGSTLSLGLIFLGVFGGVLAFGLIGVILGPVLLAVGIALGRAWINSSNPNSAQAMPSLDVRREASPRSTS